MGGVDAEGNDIANELSFLAIEARERVCMQEPNFGVRVHSGSKPEFLNRVCQSASTGKGHLQIFHDGLIIPTLIEWGVSPHDVTGYGVIGCVKLGVPGKTCNSANAALLDFAYCLELSLNQGRKMSDNFMSSFKKGGMHLQCNIMDKTALLEAKKHPEKYQDLIVRPAGFSICFVSLSPMVQDEIISRTNY